MTEKEFERMLETAPELEPRAELKEQILARATSELNINTTTVKKKPTPSPFKRLKLWIPIAACFAIALLILGGAFGLNNEKYQTVYVDVNPSVAIHFNRFEKVSEVEPLNDDAKEVLESIDLDGKTPEEAIECVVELYETHGYFETEALVLISADEKDAKIANRLAAHAEKIKGNKKYTVSSQALTSEEKEEAKEAGISPGKYRIISEILEKDPSYTFEELKDMPMSVLNKINKSLGTTEKPDKNDKNPNKK